MTTILDFGLRSVLDSNDRRDLTLTSTWNRNELPPPQARPLLPAGGAAVRGDLRRRHPALRGPRRAGALLSRLRGERGAAGPGAAAGPDGGTAPGERPADRHGSPGRHSRASGPPA